MRNPGQTAQDVLKRLRKRREELGLSQARVAEAIDVNPSYIGLLERGERIPSLDVLFELCRALRLTPAEAFADAKPESPGESRELEQVRSLFTAWPAEQRKAAVRVLKELDRIRAR